jgi:kynureninase
MMQSGRSVVLSQQGNFPTDLYMVQGLGRLLGDDKCTLRLVDDDDIMSAMEDNVAVLLLSHVNFRSGALYDMKKITQQAHAHGILVIWDLAHSAGVVPVELDECDVDFAVGCGYKYLNGGPGAPAFLYAASRHHAAVQQPLSGWMGHQAPFNFDNEYHAAAGVAGFLSGTPPVVSLSILDAALDIFADINIVDVRKKSLALADLLVTVCGHADEHCPIVSPGGAGNTGRCPIRLGRRAARTRSWPNLAGCETGFGSACPD